ncbi:substrate-binding domain-containing protein [Roseomonas sp. GC11]|uniref:LacI family DNA-binding transcriptional regulator n=1 Tax=Roseomonas sp. GC11 TaxID=2950546 RepID=UPI00210C1485|nr:substrate-binding domain-containing protein [Roseomonas sp. GC11]MCQ4162492.1 substrate-binding domain-containing protein [Roseomonas sp. GC11]
MNLPPSRVTLEDVAREAGVSLATVDRVLNRRPGVRARTESRVQAAVQRLNYRPDPAAARLARNRFHRFLFLLPSGSNSFFAQLEEQALQLRDWLAAQRAGLEIQRTDVFDPGTLARRLEAIPAGCDGVAVVALDHPRVRHAIDELAARGVPVVTLVSDVPSARRLHYVGIDNAAAGRTAATLMGRFLGGRGGAIGVLAGSLSLRDHAERYFGFAQVMERDFPGLTLLPVLEGRDDNGRNATLVQRLLEQAPGLRGLYNIGAGHRGVVAALEQAGRADGIVYIGHELTPHTRRFLLEGTLDACIAQDAGHEVRSAARLLLAQALREPVLPEQERIRIGIFVRDNLP